MVVYVRQMFNWTTASTSLTTMNAGTTSTAGPYSPAVAGKLVKIQIVITPQAASSLAQQGRVELSQDNWNPTRLEFPFAGFGLATAPQLYGGTQALFEWPIDQEARTDWPITGQAIFFFSPVTPNVVVSGFFTA